MTRRMVVCSSRWFWLTGYSRLSVWSTRPADSVYARSRCSNCDRRRHRVLLLRRRLLPLLLRVHHRHCHLPTVPCRQVNLLDLMTERRMSLDVGRKTDWRDEMKDTHWPPNDEDSLEEIDSFYSFKWGRRRKSSTASHAERLTESRTILHYRSIDLPEVKRRCSVDEKSRTKIRPDEFLRSDLLNTC